MEQRTTVEVTAVRQPTEPAVRASGLLTRRACQRRNDVIPEDLRYTAEHEWVAGDGSGPVRVGITHFAQDALGDIVFVQLPEEGTAVQAGDSLGEIESTKSVSEIYAPVAGTVVARNGALADEPELINAEPVRGGLAGRDRAG